LRPRRARLRFTRQDRFVDLPAQRCPRKGPASRELLRQALLVRYEEMAAYAQSQGEKVSFTRKEFIIHQLGNLDAL
jgi:hypothetical protein